MPERPVNRTERQQSLTYLLDRGAKIDLDFGPHNEQIIGTFKGEAFWVLFKERPNYDEMGYYGVDDYDSFRFACGDSTAQAMEAAGVLSFSEPEPIKAEADSNQIPLL